jgi:hypothetical protein
MLVLTQPTASTNQPQVTTTAGVARQALVQIESPGPGSKVRDFLWARVNVYPGDGGNVHLVLTGEDGRELSRKDLTYAGWTGGWLSIAEQMSFSPGAASEKALLSAYTLDGWGRVISLASVSVLMLQVGPEEIELPGFHQEPFIISLPRAGSTITGGLIILEGYAHITQPGGVHVDLVATDGSTVASQELEMIPSPTEVGYTTFKTDLPYHVEKRTPVRLTLRQTSADFPGSDLSIGSVILYLDP